MKSNSFTRRPRSSSALLLAALALSAAAPFALAQPQSSENGEIHVLPVRDEIYMLVGPGGANTTVQLGKQGVLVVDTQAAAASEKLLAAIRKLSNGPLRYIINTSADAEHAGGNERIRAAGVTITGANVAGNLTDAMVGAAIIAHDNVLARLSAPTGKQSAAPADAWPTDTFAGKEKGLYFNGESIRVMHTPAAHTDGDSIAYFRRSDVISTGDVFMTTTYPVIDVQRGGSIQGEIDALNLILYLAIPEHEEEGGTLIIPGHGRLCDQFDVLEYRDMIVIIRDRIRAMIKKGMTLDQVKAVNPTFEYDGRYGAKTGPWTTDMFVEAAYKSLAGKKE